MYYIVNSRLGRGNYQTVMSRGGCDVISSTPVPGMVGEETDAPAGKVEK